MATKIIGWQAVENLSAISTQQRDISQGLGYVEDVLGTAEVDDRGIRRSGDNWFVEICDKRAPLEIGVVEGIDPFGAECAD
jgi:hypothetical protein